MPSKEYLESLEPVAGESRFNRVFNYTKDNLPIVKIYTLKYLQAGNVEIVLINESNEECPGKGVSKLDALIDAVSTKYPD
jgi:hypothetical protein